VKALERAGDRTGGGGKRGWYFQEAGATKGASTTVNANLTSFDVLLNAPVTITSGQTKTFTINANSGAFDSGTNLNDYTLNCSVVPEPTTGILLGLLGVMGLLRRLR
jgi:hypothetical protein